MFSVCYVFSLWCFQFLMCSVCDVFSLRCFQFAMFSAWQETIWYHRSGPESNTDVGWRRWPCCTIIYTSTQHPFNSSLGIKDALPIKSDLSSIVRPEVPDILSVYGCLIPDIRTGRIWLSDSRYTYWPYMVVWFSEQMTIWYTVINTRN